VQEYAKGLAETDPKKPKPKVPSAPSPRPDATPREMQPREEYTPESPEPVPGGDQPRPKFPPRVQVEPVPKKPWTDDPTPDLVLPPEAEDPPLRIPSLPEPQLVPEPQPEVVPEAPGRPPVEESVPPRGKYEGVIPDEPPVEDIAPVVPDSYLYVPELGAIFSKGLSGQAPPPTQQDIIGYDAEGYPVYKDFIRIDVDTSLEAITGRVFPVYRPVRAGELTPTPPWRINPELGPFSPERQKVPPLEEAPQSFRPTSMNAYPFSREATPTHSWRPAWARRSDYPVIDTALRARSAMHQAVGPEQSAFLLRMLGDDIADAFVWDA